MAAMAAAVILVALVAGCRVLSACAALSSGRMAAVSAMASAIVFVTLMACCSVLLAGSTAGTGRVALIGSHNLHLLN